MSIRPSTVAVEKVPVFWTWDEMQYHLCNVSFSMAVLDLLTTLDYILFFFWSFWLS